MLAGPAWAIAGNEILEGMLYAAVLCLVPGWFVIVVSNRIREPNGQVLAALGGTAMRLVFVVVGAMVIGAFRPNLGFGKFLVWVAVFYFLTLWTETWQLLQGAGQTHKQTHNRQRTRQLKT